MKLDQLTIRSKCPDFIRFCQYTQAGLHKSLQTVNPLILCHLLPDRVKGMHFSLQQKAELLNTGCCVLSRKLPLFLTVRQSTLQIEYKNDGLISDKTAFLMKADCEYLDPCPHRFRINDFQPVLKNYLQECKDDLLKTLPDLEVKKPPQEALSVLPDFVLGQRLSDETKEELLRHQFAKFTSEQLLYLNLQRNSMLLIPKSCLGKPDTFTREYPVLGRSDVSFDWEREGKRQQIFTGLKIISKGNTSLDKRNDLSITG